MQYFLHIAINGAIAMVKMGHRISQSLSLTLIIMFVSNKTFGRVPFFQSEIPLQNKKKRENFARFKSYYVNESQFFPSPTKTSPLGTFKGNHLI